MVGASESVRLRHVLEDLIGEDTFVAIRIVGCRREIVSFPALQSANGITSDVAHVEAVSVGLGIS